MRRPRPLPNVSPYELTAERIIPTCTDRPSDDEIGAVLAAWQAAEGSIAAQLRKFSDPEPRGRSRRTGALAATAPPPAQPASHPLVSGAITSGHPVPSGLADAPALQGPANSGHPADASTALSLAGL